MKTIGEALRAARMKQGVTLETVSNTTHIKVRFLKALEENKFTLLPSSAIVQGFIGTYAQVVGIDKKTALAMLRRDFEVRREDIIPKNIIESKRLPVRNYAFLKKALFVLTILFVAALYGFWSYQRLHQPPSVVLLSPKDYSTTTSTFTVRGTTLSDAVVVIDGQSVAVNQDGGFFYQETLLAGQHIITVTVKNRQNQETIRQVHITVTSQ